MTRMRDIRHKRYLQCTKINKSLDIKILRIQILQHYNIHGKLSNHHESIQPVVGFKILFFFFRHIYEIKEQEKKNVKKKGKKIVHSRPLYLQPVACLRQLKSNYPQTCSALTQEVWVSKND